MTHSVKPATLETASHFDADALTAAQEAPTLTVGRYLYRGRLLSIEEWLPWWEEFQQLQKQRDDAAEQGAGALRSIRTLLDFYRRYLRKVFPRRDYRMWAPDPVKHFMQQPFLVVEDGMAVFFYLQACATFGKDAIDTAATTPSAPRGTPSPNATAAASSVP